MLTERLLQFIWQFQYFNTNQLETTGNESLRIINAGLFNTHQGPDFLQAKITLGNATWAGNIEIHIKASDWNNHKHTTDENYNNVILHVVWEDDAIINNPSGNPIPTLLFQPLVSAMMFEKYDRLMHTQEFVPCQTFLPVLSALGWQNWQERLLIERLQKRSALIFEKLNVSGNHWEETFWYLLARNFGTPVNADSFESIAQTIPLSIIAKHKNQIQQLEALLLGQAGLLHDAGTDSYVQLLQREYLFLKNKYKLVDAPIKPLFLRMRPANFPTVRLAQLAMLLHQSEYLFSKIIDAKTSSEIIALLNVTANDFWHYHYKTDTVSNYKPKVLGNQMAENILINTIVPVVFAYGMLHNNQVYKDKAVEWLSETKGEANNVIEKWKACGVTSENAMQTQGLLELKKHYCDAKKCLDCAVGNKILKQS